MASFTLCRPTAGRRIYSKLKINTAFLVCNCEMTVTDVTKVYSYVYITLTTTIFLIAVSAAATAAVNNAIKLFSVLVPLNFTVVSIHQRNVVL